ncbi:MAG: DUF58 domain-containing protein [Myxococcales bacterium]|nr:DUF58 domain-containing protein [Myxococcales bacterium]
MPPDQRAPERREKIPKELIKKLKRIEIMTARSANAQLAGAYHSVFKGIGIAFSEVRQYQPGDDVRMIDWNVTARMQDAYVKLFVEEREMTVMLLVDASGSQDFGTRRQSKREVAAEVAALLAFTAIKNNDRVGLIIFTDRVEKFVPPKKGKKHVLRVITEILTFKPYSRGTHLASGLEFLGKIANRRSVAFLVSDFLDAGYEPALKVAQRRHDLVPVTITDPLELELPAVGFLTVENPETGALEEIDTYGSGRAAYAKRVRAQAAERDQLFKRLKMDRVDIVVSDDEDASLASLIAFFRARQRRLRH